MKCKSCDTTNPEGSKFCNQCGRQLDTGGKADFAAQFPHPGPLPDGAAFGSLQARFKRLGTLAGRQRSVIEQVVGPPNSTSAAANGCVLLQWMKTSAWSGGYHIALIFDENGVCGGVTHEFAS